MSTGKTNVAPNMARTCCAPRPTVRPHDSRSSGRTTSPGAGARPSPWTVHPLITGDRLGLRHAHPVQQEAEVARPAALAGLGGDDGHVHDGRQVLGHEVAAHHP